MSTLAIGSKIRFNYITSFSFENLGSRFSVPFTKSVEIKVFDGIINLIHDADPDSQETLITVALDNGQLLTINSSQII
jgi:hypothetical protein